MSLGDLRFCRTIVHGSLVGWISERSQCFTFDTWQWATFTGIDPEALQEHRFSLSLHCGSFLSFSSSKSDSDVSTLKYKHAISNIIIFIFDIE